jgi:hypothetical protein
MPEMTDEEYDALEEFVTKYPPRVDPSKARHAVRMVALDDIAAEYLISRSRSTNKTPTELITELVWEKIALADNDTIMAVQ